MAHIQTVRLTRATVGLPETKKIPVTLSIVDGMAWQPVLAHDIVNAVILVPGLEPIFVAETYDEVEQKIRLAQLA